MKAEEVGIFDSKPGLISFTQRWGGALNLNIHLHILALDGVYTLVNDKPVFHQIHSIKDNDIADIITNISSRVITHLIKKGNLNKDGEIVNNPLLDPLFTDSESLNLATSSSIALRIAFGPNAGKSVVKIGAGFGYNELQD